MTLGKGRSPSDQLGTLQEAFGRILNVQVPDYDFGWYFDDREFPQDLTTARPLQIAARTGNSQILSMLLAHGASIDSVDGRYATPLHTAADHGQIAMVKLLLEAGANPNALDRDLQSPAMRAAEQGHVNCVRILLEAGAGRHTTSKCMGSDSSSFSCRLWSKGRVYLSDEQDIRV